MIQNIVEFFIFSFWLVITNIILESVDCKFSSTLSKESRKINSSSGMQQILIKYLLLSTTSDHFGKKRKTSTYRPFFYLGPLPKIRKVALRGL